MSGLAKWPMSLGAECESCPFLQSDSCKDEPPWSGKTDTFALLEGPGKTEIVKGGPAKGETGRHFNRMLERLRIDRQSIYVGNAMLCAPKPYTSAAEWRQAIRSCMPRLVNVLQAVPPGGLILALGARIMWALTGKGEVRMWRGYPLPAIAPFEFLNERGVIIYPTYHPSFVLRTPGHLPVEKIDWQRAIEMKRGEIKPWVWADRHIDPDVNMLQALERIRRAEWAGVDVETAGTNPFVADLLCIGLGVADGEGEKEEAVSVPWPSANADISALTKEILALGKIRKALHNGPYDWTSLATWSAPLSNIDFDTMIAHRIVAPQLPHDLGFVASLEFAAPRWKSLHKVGDDRKGSERWAIARGDGVRYRALREYNCGDALMTAKLRSALERRMSE